MGQVIGQSDSKAAVPVGQTVTTEQVFSTIMNALFDVPELRLRTNIPPEIARAITGSSPIPQLV